MSTVQLEMFDDGVAVLWLDHKEQNRFDDVLVDDVLEHFAQAESEEEVRALVFCGKNQKYFSTGLSLDWAMQQDASVIQSFFVKVNTLMTRTLLYPKPVIGCLNGHTFGFGAIWSLAFDFRLMNASRGWLCIPAIDLDLELPPAMLNLVRHALPASCAYEMLMTGARFGGQDAKRLGFVKDACAPDELLDKSIALAAQLGTKTPHRFAAMKHAFRTPLAALFPTD